MKRIIIIALLLPSVFYCTTKTGGKDQNVVKPTLTGMGFEGNFVSDGYDQKDEGYDWVAISIRLVNDTVAEISIRSRSDKKKPTCSFDGQGILNGEKMLIAELQDGKQMLLNVDGDQLNIQAANPEDENMLYYYCSGGATLAGTYNRITDPLDESQLGSPPFEKNLSLQGISFNIHATNTGSINTLTIQPVGLEIDNRIVEQRIEGTVTNAEIEDLNSDGSPELMVYIQSAGSGSYGSLIAYSVNNKKSMSQIYLPDIRNNQQAAKGYMGHDEFAVVETSLVRRFPVYREGDTNNNPTGGIRQIQYKLVNGEAGRIFKIERITEF